MITVKDVLLAQKDSAAREKLIKDSLPEIRRCASKAMGRWIDEYDDAYSVAMIAFNDAITAFSIGKGTFSAFAATVIRNRIKDHLRCQKKDNGSIAFSELSNAADTDDPQFEPADPCSYNEDLVVEIMSLEMELRSFQIIFSDLPKVSPKTERTRRACRRAVSYIVGDEDMLNQVLVKKQLPGRQLLEVVDVNEKVLERYRKYIIAGVLICAGGYTGLRDYFYGGEKI